MQETVTESGQRLSVIGPLALLLVLLLLAVTFRVLLPFAGVLAYAVIVATATSGLFDQMVDLLNERRHLAAVLFGAVAVTITVVPLIYRREKRGTRRRLARWPPFQQSCAVTKVRSSTDPSLRRPGIAELSNIGLSSDRP